MKIIRIFQAPGGTFSHTLHADGKLQLEISGGAFCEIEEFDKLLNSSRNPGLDLT